MTVSLARPPDKAVTASSVEGRTSIVAILAIITAAVVAVAHVTNLYTNWLVIAASISLIVWLPGRLIVGLFPPRPDQPIAGEQVAAVASVASVAVSLVWTMLIVMAGNLIGLAAGVDRPLGRAGVVLAVTLGAVTPAFIVLARTPVASWGDGMAATNLRVAGAWPRCRPLVWMVGPPVMAVATTSAMDGGSKVPAVVLLTALTAALGWGLHGGSWTAADRAALLAGAGAAIVWSFTLRGAHINGSDILSEFRVLSAVLADGRWTPTAAFQSAYNACLSITVLPVALVRLTGADAETVMRLLPVAGALIGPCVLLSARRWLRWGPAVTAAVITIGYSTYVFGLAMHARQAVALGLFAATVLVLGERTFDTRSRTVLAAALAAGTVLAHYSTAYVTVVLLGGLVVAAQIGAKLVAFRRSSRPSTYAAAWPVAFVALLVTVVWYGPVTQAAAGLVAFAREALTGTGSGSWIALQLFNPLYRVDVAALLAQASAQTAEVIGTETIASLEPSTYRGSGGLFSSIVVLVEFATGWLVRVGVVVGAVLVTWRARGQPRQGGVHSDSQLRAANVDVDLWAATVVAGTALAAAFAVPLLAVDYSIERIYQQLLIVLAPAAALGIWVTASRLAGGRGPLIAGALTLAYFAFGTGLIPTLAGTGESRFMQTHAQGTVAEQTLVTDADVAAAGWLADHHDGAVVRAGDFGWHRLAGYGPLFAARKELVLAPPYVGDDEWIYLTEANVRTRRAYVSVKGQLVGYELDLSELTAGRTLRFSAGDARVYR